jgi:hypothetical protein
MTFFLSLISILFGSRGGNGRLLYCGVQDLYYIETRTDDLFYFSFQFSLGAGAGTGGCNCAVQGISTSLKPEQMTFLFLISILFGSRGGSTTLKPEQMSFLFPHFNSIW